MKETTARTDVTAEIKEEPNSIGLGLIPPNTLEMHIDTDNNLKLERSPSKQKSISRKRTKSLGNLRVRSQADKELVPPRPPNAWILYRSIKFKEFKARRFPSPMLATPPSSASPGSAKSSTTSHPGLQAEVSRIISDMWKTEKEDIKQSYIRMAEEKKSQHMEMFPDYKYRPRRQYGSSPAKIKAGEEGTTTATELTTPTKLKPAKKKPKAISRAHTFTIDTSLPPNDIFTIDNGNKDAAALLDSPILSSYTTPFSSIFNKRAPSPMLEDSEEALNVKAQMVKEMQQNDWLRAIASSSEGEIESMSATSSNFERTSVDDQYAIPAWRSHITSSASAPINLIWEAQSATMGVPAPSSASSWHTADQQLPWDCTDLMETLDDFSSDLCTPNLSTTPDYSSSSSPFHPYMNASAASETLSSSSLHLGASVTASNHSQEPLPSPFIFNEEQSLATSVSIHSDYQDAYFPRHQDVVPVPAAASFQDVQALWPNLASQMQKSISSRPPLPTQTTARDFPQHHHYSSSDGGMHEVSIHSQSQYVPTPAQLTPMPSHQDPYTNHSKMVYTPSQHQHQQQHPSHHQHYPGIQQSTSFEQQQPQQYNTSNVPWTDDYHTHQELINQLHRLAQEDVPAARP